MDNETIQALTMFISNCGFPIAMCLLMSYYIKSTTDSLKVTINTLCNKIDLLISKIDNERESEEK